MPSAAPASGAGPAGPAPAPNSNSSAAGTATFDVKPGDVQHAELSHSPDALHRIYHGILDTFGGKADVSYDRDPKTGEMIATKTPRQPGDQWKHIVAGALTGAAAGFGVPPGPGSQGRAAAAGFQAGYGRERAVDERKYQRANENYDAEQKGLVTQAQVAHLNAQIAQLQWEHTRVQREMVLADTGARTAMQNLVGSNPDNQDLGVFPSFTDFLKTHGANGQQIGQMNATKQLRAMPEFDAQGRPAGVHIYQITPGWDEQRNQQPVKVVVGANLDKDGKLTPNVQTIPAFGGLNGDIVTKAQAGMKDWMQAVKESAEAKHAAAETAEAGQRMKLMGEQLRLLPLTAQRTELQNELDNVDRLTTQLEQANDKDLTNEGWLQRNGFTRPPAGIKPRKAFEQQLEQRRQQLQQKVDGVLGAMAGKPGAAGGGAGGAGGGQPIVNAPAGAIGSMTGSDGREHWVDANHKDLGVKQ